MGDGEESGGNFLGHGEGGSSGEVFGAVEESFEEFDDGRSENF